MYPAHFPAVFQIHRITVLVGGISRRQIGHIVPRSVSVILSGAFPVDVLIDVDRATNRIQQIIRSGIRRAGMRRSSRKQAGTQRHDKADEYNNDVLGYLEGYSTTEVTLACVHRFSPCIKKAVIHTPPPPQKSGRGEVRLTASHTRNSVSLHNEKLNYFLYVRNIPIRFSAPPLHNYSIDILFAV